MADSPRLPGLHTWQGPAEWGRYLRDLDRYVGASITQAVNLTALAERVAALEADDSGGVTSFKGRAGAVVPLIGDYSAWFQLASDTLDTFAATDLTAFADGDVPTWDATSETFIPGSGGSSSVPYFIASGDTYTVPLYSQALFSMPIDAEGFLDVEGYLIGVD